MELTKRQREIISRSAAAVLAALLGFGAYRCLRIAFAWLRDSPGSGVLLVGAAGVVMLLVGVAAALYAVTPTSVFQRFIGPPNNTTLWENPDADSTRSWSDLLWWWI